jgi:hypothetical protein
MKVINGLYDGVSTIELDNLAAEIAATMTTRHPDFAKLAARIAVSNLHKVTSKSFSNTRTSPPNGYPQDVLTAVEDIRRARIFR